MTTGSPTLSDLTGLRDRVVALVTRIALPLLRGPVKDVVGKAVLAGDLVGYDIVTATDHAIQDALIGPLEALVPGSRAVGEEGFAGIDDPRGRPLWLLDPLDGTLNFAKGLPGFGLSLALLVEGEPVIGVVIDGVSGRVFEAVKSGGARVDGGALDRAAADPRTAPITLSSGVLQFIAERDPSALRDFLAINSRFRLIGSQALHLCYVASGALGLNVNREAKLWDDAAGFLILTEAGGVYRRASGVPLFPLVKGDGALEGKSLFSIAGSAASVAAAVEILARLSDPTPSA